MNKKNNKKIFAAKDLLLLGRALILKAGTK